MAAVLLTGLSASGTSTALEELARRGHEVLDTDHGGWTLEVRSPAGSVDHRWDEGRMAALLAQQRSGTLFLSGCVSNQGHFYDRFRAVVLLTVPQEVRVERLASRTTDAHGTKPGELEQILEDLEAVEPLLRRTATAVIDTRRPVREVVDAVEDVVRRADGQRRVRGSGRR